jgi:hypothetical protein
MARGFSPKVYTSRRLDPKWKKFKSYLREVFADANLPEAIIGLSLFLDGQCHTEKQRQIAFEIAGEVLAVDPQLLSQLIAQLARLHSSATIYSPNDEVIYQNGNLQHGWLKGDEV